MTSLVGGFGDHICLSLFYQPSFEPALCGDFGAVRTPLGGDWEHRWPDVSHRCDGYFTRMRFITPDNLLDFNAKEATANSHSLIPWFSHPKIVNAQHDLIFGHWAALEGQTPYKHLYALDTGCVWGGSMTLIDLQSKQKFSEKSQLLSK